MHYRLVYDVLNDGNFPWLGAFFTIVPILFAVALSLELIDRLRGKRPTPPPARGMYAIPVSGLIVSIPILCFFGLFSASTAYQCFVQRQRCKQWVRTGQYQVTEGTVADHQFRKAGDSFRVADLFFDLLERSCGFTGRFNATGAAPDCLRDGLRVRLAHRDGFILRVEVAP